MIFNARRIPALKTHDDLDDMKVKTLLSSANTVDFLALCEIGVSLGCREVGCRLLLVASLLLLDLRSRLLIFFALYDWYAMKSWSHEEATILCWA